MQKKQYYTRRGFFVGLLQFLLISFGLWEKSGYTTVTIVANAILAPVIGVFLGWVVQEKFPFLSKAALTSLRINVGLPLVFAFLFLGSAVDVEDYQQYVILCTGMAFLAGLFVQCPIRQACVITGMIMLPDMTNDWRRYWENRNITGMIYKETGLDAEEWLGYLITSIVVAIFFTTILYLGKFVIGDEVHSVTKKKRSKRKRKKR